PSRCVEPHLICLIAGTEERGSPDFYRIIISSTYVTAAAASNTLYKLSSESDDYRVMWWVIFWMKRKLMGKPRANKHHKFMQAAGPQAINSCANIILFVELTTYMT
ncbi:hypothetical protein CUMW_092270, partial [Citrus unshiu]